MPLFVNSNGRSQIDSAAAFCELQNGKLPSPDKSFLELISFFDTAIKRENPDVSSGALNNVHGKWYEWLITICACNYHSKFPNRYMVFPLPNIKQYDVAKLYVSELYDYIVDLREKVQNCAAVQLISSNPDFVIIDPTKIEIPAELNRQINEFDKDTIRQIDTAYEFFTSKCDFEDIVGYISCKTSLRPDRRLQIPHEGSLMKAIYTHLQTRQWVIKPKGLKYYAITAEVSDADREALKTVATHSITTVFDKPQAAVDDLFKVDSFAECEQVFDQILTP